MPKLEQCLKCDIELTRENTAHGFGQDVAFCDICHDALIRRKRDMPPTRCGVKLPQPKGMAIGNGVLPPSESVKGYGAARIGFGCRP